MTMTLVHWDEGWRERIAERVKEKGHASLINFVEAHPITPFHTLAFELGSDIAGAQVGMCFVQELEKEKSLRDVAADSLCRALNGNLRHGWQQGAHVGRMMAGAYSDWLAILRYSSNASASERLGQEVWQVLKSLHPPVGWLPHDSNDKWIRTALDAARIEEATSQLE